MTASPLFIVGTERSGSNLLRVILGAHPEVAIPHPPHVLRYFSEFEPSYGDLSVEAHRRKLVKDVLDFVHRHIHPWDWTPTPQALVDATAVDPSLCGIFLALYDLYAEHHGKPRWGCKSTFVIHHVEAIQSRRPGSRFIWLVRDVRDVAASSKKSVFNPYHPLLTAELWAAQQAEALDLWQRLGPQSMMRLHYEDLLSSPELSVARMCDFLGLRYHPDMDNFHRAQAAKETASLSDAWKNTAKPIQRDNSGKWKKSLTPEEVRQVEAVAGEMMDALGYERSLAGGARLQWSDHIRARLGDVVLRSEVEWKSLRGDANHWLRWKRRAHVARLRLESRLRQ